MTKWDIIEILIAGIFTFCCLYLGYMLGKNLPAILL